MISADQKLDRENFEKKIDENLNYDMEDAILDTGGSWGRFQIMSSICFFTLFCVGSQFFYSIPFY
jgi:hypothetical protein